MKTGVPDLHRESHRPVKDSREIIEEHSVQLRAHQHKLRSKAENRGNDVAEREIQDRQRIVHQ